MFRYIFLLFILLIPFFSFSLKISEVYFDGTNEFIGIYSDIDFSGDIILSGAKSSNVNLNIQISSGEEIIVGDNLEGISYFQSGLGLSISDTKAINIDLLDNSGNILDNFFVSSGDVQALNNKKTSFEKIFTGNTWYIQAVKNPVNNPDDYIVNPGYVYIQKENIGINQIRSCYLELDRKDNNYNFSYIGDFTDINWYKDKQIIGNGQSMSINLSNGNFLIEGVGKDLSGNVCTGTYGVYIEKTNIDIFTGSLKITEVYPKNNIFPEYVELKAFGNVSGDFVLQGFARGGIEINLQTTLYSGNYLILAKSYSGFLYTGNVIVFDNISLLDNGEILTIQKNGQEIDKIKYIKGESLYFSYLSGDTRYFEKNDVPSPGYDLYIKDYYKIDKKIDLDCSIYMQSYELKDDKIKINFDTNVSDKNYCSDKYRQIWTYSGGVSMGTCNPSYFYLFTGFQVVNFKIEDLSGTTLCEDDFDLLFFQKENEQENLNCYIKIQTKTDSFLSDESINFITVVNGKEIQNSNTSYTCSYFLSGQVLSNKCNPDSLKFNGGLHKIDLSVKSKTGLTCQTSMYLNLPNKNTKVVSANVNEYDCSKLSSTHLTKLTELIDNKYKTDYTKKKIFDPIKYLYVKEDENLIDSCVKLNSDNLRILVDKIRQKYKLEYTLRKIFGTNKKQTLTNQIGGLEITGVLPAPTSGLEQVILSGQLTSGLLILNGNRKYKLIDYKKVNGNYVFEGKFGLGNTKDCISLIYSGNILDSACYILPEKNIVQSKLFRTDDILFVKDFVIYNNGGNLQIEENKPFKDLKTKLKKVLSKIIKIFKRLKKEKIKYKKKYVKESLEAVKNRTRYLDLKQRYKKLKEEFAKYRKKKVDIVQSKNSDIKILKNQISFLRSFILFVKSNIDKDVYKDYLDKYRQVKKGQKIRY